MDWFFENFYFVDDPLKSLIGLCAFAFVFEFVLTFAYVLRSAKNNMGV